MDSFTNELINEKSPYLLQHASNPVNWYPWGKKAFDKAKKLDIPIFLSIGYATCHWCHVMEKESFQNPEIAKELNKAFVCIKVDREELPHIDSLYMDFAQAFMSSGGGWPLNTILTPDLKPFYAATYMPAENAHGMMGLKELIYYIKNLWDGKERQELLSQANHLVDLYKSCQIDTGDSFLKLDDINELTEEIIADCDKEHGGFQKSPKFPFSFQIDFFTALYTLVNNKSDYHKISKLTLDKMSQGGIYDQIGGGFSRYSVDEKWMIPHFEKMLYDNALITTSYIRAFQLFQEPSFKETAINTLDYIERELFSSKGFYSAEDADSEDLEGLFYIWDYEELVLHLSDEEKDIFFDRYGISIEGNFDGSNVLSIQKTTQEIAQNQNIEQEHVENLLNQAKRKLFKIRKQREKPFKDDKVLTSWNALAIITYCQAYEAFQQEKYLKIAKQTMNFLLSELFQNKQLFRRYREHEVKYKASFEDYSYLISALLTLFDSTTEIEYLNRAIFFAEFVEKNFKASSGAYYSSKEDDHFVILRKCEMVDGSMPSPNAVHAENLLRLYILTKDKNYHRSLEEVLMAGSHSISQYPKASMYFLKVYLRYLTQKDYLIVIALDENRTLETPLRNYFSKHYIPFKTVIWKEESQTDFDQSLEYLNAMKPLDGQTTIYVCDKEKCYPPVLKIEDLAKIISLCD